MAACTLRNAKNLDPIHKILQIELEIESQMPWPKRTMT